MNKNVRAIIEAAAAWRLYDSTANRDRLHAVTLNYLLRLVRQDLQQTSNK